MIRDALSGLTVLDFTHVGAGPTCTMLLGDMGADIVKVEPPEGELGRKLGPAWIGTDSALFHGLNRNKRSIALDLKSERGVDIARKLALTADILVESMRPGVMTRLGLGPDVVRESNPRLIYCSISAYGQDGPYTQRAGVDGILQADSGLMSIIGTPGAEPAKVQAPIIDVFTGYVAATGVLARLHQRSATGAGCHIDINLFNAALALQQVSLTNFLTDGKNPELMGSAAPYSAPNEAFETADGWIMLAAYNGNRWERLCEVVGRADLAADPRFVSSPKRVANREAMRDVLGEVFRSRPTQNWLDALLTADILCAPVARYADLVRHPQLVASRMIAGIDDPRHGLVRAPGLPIDSMAANALPHRPAPALGEHSRELLEGLGIGAAEIERLLSSGIVGTSPPPERQDKPREAARPRSASVA
ncbi:MAG: CoA transferase [Beijerinckiaceae bacterium]|nr:CoA transferase [Beijerinckiaceae bacterium]